MPKTFNRFTGKLAPKEHLNPAIFDSDKKMNTDVRDSIIDRGYKFLKMLGIDNEDALEDIRLVGGSASLNWDDSSDLDITLQLRRDLPLTKQQVRQLGISASNLTYKLSPSVEGMDLNYFIGHKNIGGGARPAQSVYSLFKDEFLKGPYALGEYATNYIVGKSNSIVELIESCMLDDEDENGDCAAKLLKKLKAYRVRGIYSKDGEQSTPNMVWRLLSRSGYIGLLKEKVGNLEKDFFRIKNPSMIRNEEFRALIKEDTLVDYPTSLLIWNKRVLQGRDPRPLIKRVKPILDLFVTESKNT